MVLAHPSSRVISRYVANGVWLGYRPDTAMKIVPIGLQKSLSRMPLEVYIFHIPYTLRGRDSMRTNIVIDDDLMQRAMRATGAKTKRETVEMGLASLIRLKEQQDIRNLRGKLSWTGDLEQMRRDK